LDVTVTEAAERLGLSPATVRRQILNGKLAARKSGRDWDVTEDEIRRYRAVSRGRPGRRPKEPTLGLVDR
jgi:excisionase family DNA binding protein